MDLDAHIRRIPDFPKPGILFYDISTLLAHAEARASALERMGDATEALAPDVVAAIESRGFLFGMPIAHELDLPFVMVRKFGKLPGATITHAYDLEYGSDTIEVGQGLIEPGARVVLIDDLLATGGTAEASLELLRKVGATPIGFVCLIELAALEGRKRLSVPIHPILTYAG
jgi:adenine phosphoribosyltransferase